MLENIVYYQILGFPLIAYVGVSTLILLISTALIQILNRRGLTRIDMKWHIRLAYLTILVALVHGFLGMALHI